MEIDELIGQRASVAMGRARRLGRVHAQSLARLDVFAPRWHLLAMGVRKLSIALDERVVAAARASATEEGSSLSAWLNDAAETRLRVQAGLRGIGAYEKAHGAIPAAAMRRADVVLDRAGVGRIRRPRRVR